MYRWMYLQSHHLHKHKSVDDVFKFFFRREAREAREISLFLSSVSLPSFSLNIKVFAMSLYPFLCNFLHT